MEKSLDIVRDQELFSCQKFKTDLVENENKTIEVLSKSLDKLDDNEKRFSKLENELDEVRFELNAKKQLSKYGDYTIKFNDSFFYQFNKPKASFYKKIGIEKNDVIRDLNAFDFDNNNIEHQNKAAQMPCHKEIIEYYLRNGLDQKDYFNLNMLRVERNNDSHPLPTTRDAFLSLVRNDIQNLEDICNYQTLSIYKSTIEKLLNCFLEIYTD